MMALYDLLLAPFVEYGFMRRALIATLCLGLGSGPVGVLLLLRRMSLVGDAMSHAVLPGAAIGFLVAGGLSLTAMGIGGVAAGLAVALLSGLVSRTTALKEDASFASFYLASLATGVLIVSLRGLEHRPAPRAVRHHPRDRCAGPLSGGRNHLGEPCPPRDRLSPARRRVL